MSNIMTAWDALNHQDYGTIPCWFARSATTPFAHPEENSPDEGYFYARQMYCARQMKFQLHLAKQRYESIKGAKKNTLTNVWEMEEGLDDFHSYAATMECFSFELLCPEMAGTLWGHTLLDIMKQDHVQIVLKGCHGWIGEPATLFTCMTPEEREARFAPVTKKNRMVDTTLMTTPWVEHPRATVRPRNITRTESQPIVSLADRVAMDDVTTTMKLVDAGGHMYYMTHVPRWGRLHSMDNNRISRLPKYVTVESLMAADKKQSGPNDAI